MILKHWTLQPDFLEKTQNGSISLPEDICNKRLLLWETKVQIPRLCISCTHNYTHAHTYYSCLFYFIYLFFCLFVCVWFVYIYGVLLSCPITALSAQLNKGKNEAGYPEVLTMKKHERTIICGTEKELTQIHALSMVTHQFIFSQHVWATLCSIWENLYKWTDVLKRFVILCPCNCGHHWRMSVFDWSLRVESSYLYIQARRRQWSGGYTARRAELWRSSAPIHSYTWCTGCPPGSLCERSKENHMIQYNSLLCCSFSEQQCPLRACG